MRFLREMEMGIALTPHQHRQASHNCPKNELQSIVSDRNGHPDWIYYPVVDIGRSVNDLNPEEAFAKSVAHRFALPKLRG